MADTDTTEENLPLSEFVRVGNAREHGQEAEPAVAEPITPVVEASADPAIEPEPTPEAEAESEPVERNADGTFKKAKPFSIQKRISMAVAAQREAERQRDELAAKLAAAEAPKATPPSAVPETPAPVTASDRRRYLSMPDAPKEADYDGSDGKTYSDYTADMALFIADKRYEEREQAKVERSQTDSHFKRIDAAKKSDPTVEPRLKALAALGLDVPPYMSQKIRQSELGVDILLHLADHPDIARRLPTLHPLQQAEELGKLEAQIESAKAAARSGPAPAPVISAAKGLIKPVSTSPQVSDDDVDEEHLPLSKFIAVGNKRDALQTRRH